MADATERIAELAADLLPRQKAFADKVLEGTPYGEAYQAVYGGGAKELKAARSSASHLMSTPKVKAYIEAVQGMSIDLLIVSRAELLAQLRDVAFSGVTQGPGASARVQAAKVLIEILDGSVPIKVEHSGPDGKPIQTDNRHTGGLPPDLAEQIKRHVLGLPAKD